MAGNSIGGRVASMFRNSYDGTAKTETKDPRVLELESKLASPGTLLHIIEKIESNFLGENQLDNAKIEQDIELLFNIIDQYKFLFPLKASRLYEVCFFKKLLMRLCEENDLGSHDTFSFHHLITIVLRKQKEELGTPFCARIEKLLEPLEQDLQVMIREDGDVFQKSLNIQYLHELASETGKNYLKKIEQSFQDNRAEQAMASIQTNHFLYIYLEMLHKIWSFVTGVEPICTWPAFNSTMQMHHDIYIKLYEWSMKCVDFRHQEEDKFSNKFVDEDTKQKFENMEPYLISMENQIVLIMNHMKHRRFLRYAGEAIKELQNVVLQLYTYLHRPNQSYTNSIFDVFIFYCKAKCNDNDDEMLSFDFSKDLSVTDDDDVKRVTQAILRPSTYKDHGVIDVPTSYHTHVDKLFTVIRGNLVLSKDPTCQLIINLLLTNFGITIQETVSLADSEERRKCVKASLGIITNSSDDVFLNYFQEIPFQRTKQEGSWEITVDTEDSLSKIDAHQKDALDPNSYFNMFFDDDVLELSQNKKMYLLRKFISCRFFEIPEHSTDGEESMHTFDELQEKIFDVRLRASIRILQAESTDVSEDAVVAMYQRLYGAFDACEGLILANMSSRTSRIESTDGINLETNQHKSEWSLGLGALFTKMGDAVRNFVMPSIAEGSELLANSTEDLEHSDVLLEKARKLHDQCKELAQKAAIEKDKTKKDEFEVEYSKIRENVCKICEDLIPFLQSKYEKQVSFIQTKAETMDSMQIKKDEKSEYHKKFMQSMHEMEQTGSQLHQAKELLHDYGRWEFYNERIRGGGYNNQRLVLGGRMSNANDTDHASEFPSPTTFSTDMTAGAQRGNLSSRDHENLISERSALRETARRNASLSSLESLFSDAQSSSAPVLTTLTGKLATGNHSLLTNAAVSPLQVEGPARRDASLASSESLVDSAVSISAADASAALPSVGGNRMSGLLSRENTQVFPTPGLPTNASAFVPGALSIASPAAVGAQARGGGTNKEPGSVKQEIKTAEEPADELGAGSNITIAASGAAAADTATQPASNSMLQIAPILDMEFLVEKYSTSEAFTDNNLRELVERHELVDILLPKDIKGFDGKKVLPATEDKFKLNIAGYLFFVDNKKNQYEFLSAHAFVLVNSTRAIREVARSLLTNFAKTGGKSVVNQKISFCKGSAFRNCLMPAWIDNPYLNKVQNILPMPSGVDNRGNMTPVTDILNLKESGVFQDKELQEDVKNELKARYLLLIALTEMGIQEQEESRLVSIKLQESNKSSTRSTAKQGQTSRGLFTQPPAWCDDGADERPPESARVCCRCGMCTRVEEKTDLLAYRTAPPTHPLLNACSTHPVYSAPSTLVWTAVPMGSMGAGIQARRVYILQR